MGFTYNSLELDDEVGRLVFYTLYIYSFLDANPHASRAKNNKIHQMLYSAIFKDTDCGSHCSPAQWRVCGSQQFLFPTILHHLMSEYGNQNQILMVNEATKSINS